MIPESDENLMRRAILGLAPKAGQTYSEDGGRIVWTVMTVSPRTVIVEHGAGCARFTRDYWLMWLKGKKRLT